jgi:uncharacterized protein (TIGR00255 family)
VSSAAPGFVRSMTGVGSHVAETAEGRFEVEARAVNHRFLKVSLRAGGPLPELAAEVEELVRARVGRGHVSLSLRFVPSGGARPGARIDAASFAAAATQLKALCASAGLPPPGAADVLAMPGVVGSAGADDDVAAGVKAAALAAVAKALDTFDQARVREGRALSAELLRLLGAVDAATKALAERAAEVPGAWQARLHARLADLLEGGGAALEPQALAREVALMAEKSDVTEELARLAAHAGHARALLAEGGAVGRSLDFLVQEMNREANTVGSKANDLALTRTVIGLKADVERLREQVQNLE